MQACSYQKRKKTLNCVQRWVKFLIQDAILEVSRRKNCKGLPCGAFLLCVVDEMFIEMLLFQETSALISPLEVILQQECWISGDWGRGKPPPLLFLGELPLLLSCFLFQTTLHLCYKRFFQNMFHSLILHTNGGT